MSSGTEYLDLNSQSELQKAVSLNTSQATMFSSHSSLPSPNIIQLKSGAGLTPQLNPTDSWVELSGVALVDLHPA